VGDHKITEAELDAKVKSQMAALLSKMYDIKRQALESMADDYLIEQAAKKSNLSVDQYVQKQMAGQSTKVTDEEARKFYDTHKTPGSPPFDQLKDRLIPGL